MSTILSQGFHKISTRFPQVYRKSDVKIIRPFYRQTVYMSNAKSNARFSELSVVKIIHNLALFQRIYVHFN